MMKKILSIFLSIFLLCSALPAPTAAAEESAELTLMVYISGSDLESGSGAATGDITEMLRSGVDTDRVNILLMTGGSCKWWGGFPSDQLCIYKAEGRRPTLLEQSPLVSMGESGTLSYFLNYGYQNFPAQQYALILWDHGGGPMNGVCYDELFNQRGSLDNLSLMELRDALTASPFSAGQPLEWIGFDACLMSAVETAHICAPFARYMIASQETEPGTGWSYSFLSGMNGSCTGADAGRMIIDSYFADTRANAAMTLSCIDLSRIGAVEDAMDGLFGELDQIITPESFSQLSNSRREARSIGRASTGSDYDLVDLCHLAMQYEQHAPDAARRLQEAVRDAVVYQNSNIENTYGLSVYYPYYNKNYYSALWMDVYSDLDFADGYLRYMTDYASLWLGESLADWGNLRTAALPALENNTQMLTMPLTEDQLAHFASAELYVLDEFPSGGGYYDIYHTDDVQLDGGVLSAKYDYRALYALDADGKPVSDALTYIIQDDTYLVRAALTETNFDLMNPDWADSNKKPVYLQCVLNEQTDELEIIGLLALPNSEAIFAYPSEEALLLSGKQTATLDSDDWPLVYFLRHPRVLTRDGNNSALPYPDWPYPFEAVDGYIMLEYYEVDNTQPWTLKFCEQQYSGRSLQAQYVVTDTQGTRFASDLLPIENLSLTDSYDLSLTSADNDEYCIRLTRADVVDSTLGAGLYIYGTFENRSEEQFHLSADTFIFEETVLGLEGSSSSANFADKEISALQNFHFFIPAEQFPPMADSRLDSFRFNLRVLDSSYKPHKSIPVVCEQSIDLSSILEPSQPVEPMAVTAVGDASCELLGLTETAEGVNARLHIVNNGVSHLTLDWYVCDAAINGSILSGSFHGKNISLPSGCDQYIDAVFRRTTPSHTLLDEALPEVDGFDYWSIDSIETLSILPIDPIGHDETVFVLTEPFSVQCHPVENPRETLFSGDELAIELHRVAHTGDTLTAELALTNRSGVDLELSVREAMLNGQSADSSLIDESGYSYFDACRLPASASLRAALTIDLPESTPEILELAFRWGSADDDDVDRITSAAVIDCTASAVTTAAELLRNDPIDPMSLIDTEVSLPEDAARYRTTLTAQLTEAQIATFERASVVLAQYAPDREAYRLSYLKHDAVLGEDGQLSVDYHGMLVCAEGQQHPFLATQQSSGEDINILAAYLSAPDWDAPNLNYDSIIVHLADDLSCAEVQSATTSRTVYEQEKFPYLNLMYQTQISVRRRDGTLAHILDWTHDSFIAGQYYEIPDSRARFSMVPAADIDSLYAIFCIYNTDGSSYSLDPIPYADACIAQ